MNETKREPAFAAPPHHLAWWSGSLASFRSQDRESIVERLNLRLVEARYTSRDTNPPTLRNTLQILHDATSDLPDDWQLLLEYPLLRLGHRLDAVLISDRAIFAIEFKSASSDNTGRRQVEDYALDLHFFHAGSRHHPIVPILVVTDRKPQQTVWPLLWHGVARPVFDASGASLKVLLNGMVSRIPHRGVDILGWEAAPYRPVPSIVEAATMLYSKHGVSDIAEARADTGNLTNTKDVILEAIADARINGAYIIVFVTGIPGAGKTLCGLNAVFGADTGAAFLTGNLPLVHVLREALARDAVGLNVPKENGKRRSRPPKGAKAEALRKAKQAIQGLTDFITDNIDRSDPPHEHVIVFDEAQRAWDADYGAKSKFKRKQSEAALVLDIMRRHLDYAVVVALVGNGQEINNGEAGLGEWGRALVARPEWQIRAARDVLETQEPRQRLFDVAPEGIILSPSLHLNVSMRDVRTSDGAAWVDAVLRGNLQEAKQHASAGVPFFVTRSLTEMRAALRDRTGGERRAGLVCSSGAKRLVADGIWPNFDHLDDSTVANWFLNYWPDVRASDALEIPATQFACQGLELDYVGLCWGGDFTWDGSWMVRSFVGTKWTDPKKKKQDAIDFCRNTYRVLLSRARYDTIIWVPEGDSGDETREPRLFDKTAAFLVECGATLLEQPVARRPPPTSPPLL